VVARENAMTEFMSEEDQSARDESEIFDKGPLTARENRILVDGGVAIPIPRLIRHIEKVLNIPVSKVDWINSESTAARSLLIRGLSINALSEPGHPDLPPLF
jgi:hypothetical protein